VQLDKQILNILDDCCEAFTFPMLDNGYVYPAASRLTLFRSDLDWAIVIELFGFSPRSGLPDINVSTFASRLRNRDSREKYVNEIAYNAYLKNNPNNESRFYYPIEEGPWQDEENGEFVAVGAQGVLLRGKAIAIPAMRHLRILEFAWNPASGPTCSNSVEHWRQVIASLFLQPQMNEERTYSPICLKLWSWRIGIIPMWPAA